MASIRCRYFCRYSFATWNILLPMEEQAAKLASSDITTKFFWLQLKYIRTLRICITLCNVLVDFTEHVLTSFLRTYRCTEEVTPLRAILGMAYEDYTFWICFKRDGFQVIPDTINFKDHQLIVVTALLPLQADWTSYQILPTERHGKSVRPRVSQQKFQ